MPLRCDTPYFIWESSVLWTCTCQWHIHVLKVQPIRLPNCSNLIGGRVIQDFFLYLIPFDKAVFSDYVHHVTHRLTFKKCSRFFPKTTVCRHWTTAANPMDPSRTSTSNQVQSSPAPSLLKSKRGSSWRSCRRCPPCSARSPASPRPRPWASPPSSSCAPDHQKQIN